MPIDLDEDPYECREEYPYDDDELEEDEDEEDEHDMRGGGPRGRMGGPGVSRGGGMVDRGRVTPTSSSSSRGGPKGGNNVAKYNYNNGTFVTTYTQAHPPSPLLLALPPPSKQMNSNRTNHFQ